MSDPANTPDPSQMVETSSPGAGPSTPPRRAASPRPEPPEAHPEDHVTAATDGGPSSTPALHQPQDSAAHPQLPAPTSPAQASVASAPVPHPTSVLPDSPSPPSPYPQPQPRPSSQPIPNGDHVPSHEKPSSVTPDSRRTLLSHHLQRHPDHSAKQAMATLFPKRNPIYRLLRRFKVKHSVIDGMTDKEMARWTAEGASLREKAGWKLEGEQGEGLEDRVVVSDLFWKMYLSLLPTLERDPLSGLVPPDLLGSTTTMPLSVISLIPDIMQHYRDVIIRAEKEIFLATNYWQPSNSVTTISGVLRELSDLVVKNNRPKVVVKIMYDRGSWEQLWNAHAPVNPKEWGPLHLPTQDQVEGLELEVINFHRVLLGTFHAKFLVVDRKVALLNSNNIQDRPNLELMTHFEGPVVDAFYEIALHSWYNKLSPPLPCMATPYEPPRDSHGNIRYLFADHNPYFDDIEILKAARAARLLLRKQTKEETLHLHEEGGRFREAVIRAMDRQRDWQQEWKDWRPGEEFNARAQSAMHELREFRDRWAMGMERAMSGALSVGGSRPGSRGPSRRSSTSGQGLKAGHYADDETAAITARNATLAAPIDPSEAPSTPTISVDLPPKSKTMPSHHSDLPTISPNHPQTRSPVLMPVDAAGHGYGHGHGHGHGHGKKDKSHVMFLDTKIPSHILDESVIVDSPSHSVPSSPLLTPRDREKKDLPALPGAGQPTQSTESSPQKVGEDHTAVGQIGHGRGQSPLRIRGGGTGSQDEVPIAAGQPKNELGENLPATAQMPQELDRSTRPDVGAGPAPTIPLTANGENESQPRLDGPRTETKTVVLDEKVLGVPGRGKENGTGAEGEKRPSIEDQPEGTGSRRMFQLSKKFNEAGVLSEAWATVEDSDELDNFRPHVVHSPHDPFPVAMCCRKPHGFPGHHDIRNPQNAAWLAGMRYAKKKIFIQSPTLNARPIVRGVKQACRRGVEVVLLLDLGFNDKGESIPFQGGTNEEVVDRLYKALKKEGKEQHLKVYWYTGKDQVRPLNAVKKQRNCHIKFAAYDDEVIILGNGNQDSQSWFHSQEVNVMLDNKQICSEMMDTLLSNQNTMQYGLVSPDGKWRDGEGKTLEDYGLTEKGAFRGLSAFIRFAKSV